MSRSIAWRHAVATAALLLAVLPTSRAAEPSPWTLATPEHTLSPGVRETAWTSARPPGGPFDRIGVHRYRGTQRPFATVLYLPGKHMNGEAVLKDERHNLWLYLAARGVEVFAVDYRTHAVPADTPAAALASLEGWGLQASVDDIRAAAAWARHTSGRSRVFVAGFSRGVGLGFAYAGTEPEAVAGLIALDGAFKNPAGEGRYDAGQARRDAAARPAWAVDVGGSRGYATRLQILQAAARDPAGPAPDTRFATASDQLVDLVQTAWGDGGLANPRGGFSRPEVLGALLSTNDRYYPVAEDIDTRALGDRPDDPTTTLDDRWGRLGVPVIAFASTGLGAGWIASVVHTAAKSGSRDVEQHFLRGYGHLDVVVGEHAQRDVFEPVLDWLKVRAR